MANLTRNFVAGKMNKTFDERVVPAGEYIDALNIRMGSTENSEVGAVENSLGNLPLTTLMYKGQVLSGDARCIGAYQDGANETIYWFVHDPDFALGPTGKLDLIVSVNVLTSTLTYHVISINDGGGVNTTLNFNPTYVITGVDLVDNLLFFTDDYNPPRFINVKRGYANPNAFYFDYAGNPTILAEALQVIKKPPVQSPTVVPYITPGQEEFLTDRFISFAYRYRYSDNEYSATSQWSDIAFVPKPFDLSLDSYLNEGMTNIYNAVNVTYNTGGPLVVGIDLLFKEANDNVIKVIEKLNKAELGLSDNTNETFQFVNSKIFTILPQSEILRLYDNVPRFAKAQTIMGNRLMYGNYVEGYNLIDRLGNPTKITYTTELISEDINNSTLITSRIDGNYNFRGLSNTISDSITIVELSGFDLVEGSILNVNLTIKHNSFDGDTPFPSQTTQNTEISFSFYLPVSYPSVYDMVTSTEFVNAVGTATNIQPIYTPVPGPTSCDGNTWTDIFNCAIPNNLNSLFKYASGITGWLNQPIAIYCAPGDTFFQIQLPAMLFIDAYPATTKEVVEYYEVVSSEAFLQVIANSRSLHSNRGYEIGIVYMDEYNRSTTALVSNNNTVAVPCGYSPNKNSIRVTIPTTQIAPSWATRYKFVIKADEENYDTIYSNIYFQDPLTNATYFLIEGENPRKVNAGDRLIVKADSNGPTQSCVYATVLEKEAKQEDFINITNVTVPSGTYIKINANNFSALGDSTSLIAPPKKTVCSLNVITNPPYVLYPMNIEDPSSPGTYIDYNIPAGSIITMRIKQSRLGRNFGDCEKRIYTLNKDFVSSANYANMKAWWDGDNIASILNTGDQEVGDPINDCPIGNTYIPTLGNLPITSPVIQECVNYYQFYRDTSNNALYLYVSGTFPCGGLGSEEKRKSCVDVKFSVLRAENTIIFETEPSDTLPDVFFENNLSFPIDSQGNHLGNVQNQFIAGGIPGIVDTGFFNCFSFGNGAESYKIRDSIIGRSFNLGERVTSVAAQDYKEADRFADITYSGVYNDESNVNKLNEFNLGLLNFKPLEDSFGPIQILDARQTDVLTLQEDKISYVLAGKNLLSDAAGGGAVASIPEVLGTQIARTEKYGISYNPESYVQWGQDRFFTDAKRGAVIQLRGDESGAQQLRVASEPGMRTWFRDLFNQSFLTQKLGGFDPYSNEYVLSSNEQPIPSVQECLSCGVSQTFNVEDAKGDKLNYCVNLGFAVGNVVITYNIISIAPTKKIKIDYDYNGSTGTTGLVSTSGTITFNKNTNAVNFVDIEFIATGQVVVEVTVACPTTTQLTLVEVVLTNNFEAGETIHAEYYYTNAPYISPVQSNLVTFTSGVSNPLVSRYNTVTGAQGTAGIPINGSIMTIATNKIGTDTFVFDPASDSFKYLRSNTLYPNTTLGISNLIGAASLATPLMGGGVYNYANFNVGSSGSYLYLIWDFRNATLVDLCYSATSIEDVCCSCSSCEDPCSTWRAYAYETMTIGYYDCTTNGYDTIIVTSGDETTFCARSWFNPTITEGDGSLELLQECGCGL